MDKLTRKELKHDKFQEEVAHSIDYLSEHKELVRKYGGIAGAVVLVIVIGWAFMRYQASSRQEAFRAALQVQEGFVGDNPPPGAKAFKTQQEKDDASVKAFNDVASRYSGSTEGEGARYLSAIILSDQGKMAEAEKALQTVVNDGGKEYSALAKIALANIYMGQGKNKEAENLVKPLIDSPTLLVSKEQAQVLLARIYMKTNPVEARKIVEELQKVDRPKVQAAAVGVLGELPGSGQ